MRLRLQRRDNSADNIFHRQSDPDQQAVEDEEYYPYTGFMYGRQPIKEIPEMWYALLLDSCATDRTNEYHR